jgi:hypothetical protein
MPLRKRVHSVNTSPAHWRQSAGLGLGLGPEVRTVHVITSPNSESRFQTARNSNTYEYTVSKIVADS